MVSNSSNLSIHQEKSFDAEDEEMLQILEELHSSNRETSVMGISSITADENRLTGYFCSDTIFNLSNRVLTDIEIKVLEKGLDFALIQRKINDLELRSDFGEICRTMRIKWHFLNEPTLDFSKKLSFHTKSSWNPPKGDPHLEVFLSKVEEEFFTAIERPVRHSSLSQEEWKAIRSLVDDKNIVIKKVVKDSCVVIWDRNDYVAQKLYNYISYLRFTRDCMMYQDNLSFQTAVHLRRKFQSFYTIILSPLCKRDGLTSRTPKIF